jgi:hypothetical protein
VIRAISPGSSGRGSRPGRVDETRPLGRPPRRKLPGRRWVDGNPAPIAANASPGKGRCGPQGSTYPAAWGAPSCFGRPWAVLAGGTCRERQAPRVVLSRGRIDTRPGACEEEREGAPTTDAEYEALREELTRADDAEQERRRLAFAAALSARSSAARASQ